MFKHKEEMLSVVDVKCCASDQATVAHINL